MMDGLGKEKSICSSGSFPWLNHLNSEAPSRVWKLTDCFSSPKQTTPASQPQSSYMEVRKPVLELKDVPPPPLHSASQQPLPLAPLPVPPPCHLPPPPDPRPPQGQTLALPLSQPRSTSPKVSLCSRCESSLLLQQTHGLLEARSHSFGDPGGGCSISSNANANVGGGGLPTLHFSHTQGSTLSGQSTATPSSAPYLPSPQLQTPESFGLKMPSVATSQPMAAHSHPSCCACLRHLHTCPSLSVGCVQSSHVPGSGSASIHEPCMTSSGYGDCSGECRLEQNSHSHSDAPPSTHLCSNPLHLSVEHSAVCLKGAHYCHQCLSKPVQGLDATNSAKVWPNIPPPHAQSAPVPVCNGCGVPGSSTDGILLHTASLNKVNHKYGTPENSGQESLPPVGVFWDIENCAVPSGRSAAIVVQRLRDRFFQGHREAEFICVCDISKENKAVIQELNNCQVTVAHINATAKNAADDKLRQSLRRFAETHTAPATVIVVSSDVNFASELSDLRHRHRFQVILVHKSQASLALLQHAHVHVPFEDFVSELPPRMLIKSQPCFNLLFVHNLPTHRDAKAVSSRLQRLSNNCGGKVLGVSGGTAVLRFASAEAAERAAKRMENEDVLGNRITVSFSPDGRQQEEEEERIRLPVSSSSSSAALFLPLEKPRSPRRPRRVSRSCQSGRDVGVNIPERPYSPRKGGHASSCSPVMKLLPQDASALDSRPRTGFTLEKSRAASMYPQSNSLTSQMQASKPGFPAELLHRSRRRDSCSLRSVTDSPVEPFQVSTPSAFSKLSLHTSFSPMLLSQGSCSSRSASPCLSNRSSPLSVQSRSPCPDSRPELPFSDGADIQVANLDYRMSRKELQQILLDTFAKHGRVKNVELSPHTDYQLKAKVQMGSLQQAIGAISILHRFKIGNKRIHVSLLTGANSKSLACLSSEIISILQDSPANCLPLFKFTEIYEKKFGRKLVVSELYRLPEVVAVREQGGSRLVCLLSSSIARHSPLSSSQSHDGSSTSGSPVVFEELEYHEPVCKRHYTQQDFSEADYDPDTYKIPFVVVSLKALSAHVHCLLQSHEGTVPLLSFLECYAAEFSPLTVGEEGTLEGSVPLEHLITCIPGITIVTAQNGFKIIKWIHNKPPPSNADPWLQRCKSPVGNPQLIQFSREIVDLMKSQPSCLMPITKFIPAYHHHFAKQCRVSDYGYSKLLELLEAVPHVLQILGLGSKRLLTLTHRAQVKRFTQDLLKLLKFQASKQVVIRDFMQAYHWCFSRNWHVVDYGMCDLMDLLTEIPDTTISITQQDSDTVISVPKRERTPEEVERTKQFGKEVVDLLRHQPHFRMPFSKFIPTYHHHFGRQCKLTYYGFSKLMELFEAIPDVLQVLECGEEKVLALTEVERVKALAAQLVKLLRAQRDCSLSVNQLLAEYSKTFGYGLRLQDYDACTLPALLAKLCHVVKVVDGADGKEVQLINRKSLRALTSQLLAIMMSLPDEHNWLEVEALRRQYELMFDIPLNPWEYGFVSLCELLKSLPYLVEMFVGECDNDAKPEERVRLTRLYQFARNVRALLHTYHYNQIFLTEFWGAFSKYTGREFQPREYGYSTLDELLAAIPQVVWIKGHGHKKIIVLRNDMKARVSPANTETPQPEEVRESQSPASTQDSGTHSPGGSTGDAELLCLNSASPVDLLCGPVPSCLPSPQLHPDPVLLQNSDLIHFEERSQPQLTGGAAEQHQPVHDRQPQAALSPSSYTSDRLSASDVENGTPETSSTSSVQDDGRSNTDAESHSTAGSGVTKPPQPPNLKPHATDSPSKRHSRNKVRLAANFSFSPAPSV
ncbi:meiosis regulator and mRNA stability factor 1 isoform X1 [Astyanax mexicanus]|uniref:Meiosis regulator and mRNA stability factor 1 n=1 Tax=Astyanax mexicanus TaxID=7994 RepID=A0A8B9GR69_ASTMX|nr:meiosis regulator and mRNA stability factor 1 isoform X1 [Astyanax mexicanus]